MNDAFSSLSRWQAKRSRPRKLAAAVLIASTCLGFGAHAADVVVRISGIASPLGQIGCALFSGPAGFPMDSSRARNLWLPADPNGVTCRFERVPEGVHVISIGHDVNGNRKIDANFLGMPTEQWGVSNNVRPTLRAPTFEEAAFKVGAGDDEIVLDIKVAK